MEKRKLEVGEIVQLRPDTCGNKMLGGCLMVVTEPKNFGAQGYVQMGGKNGEIGGQSYYRASWEEMDETGGHSPWRLSGDLESDSEQQ
jgi:hypothetical protein